MSSIWTVRRSVTDRKVSGLSAGLARAWDVDPMLVRVGFAVLALSGGIGLVLYAAGWLMLPAEDKDQSQLEEWIPQTRTWSREVKIGVVVAACIIGALALSWLVPFSFSAALVVAAVWYFGYYRNRRRPGDRSEQPPRLQFAEFPGEPTAFTEAAKAWQQRIAEYQEAVLCKPTPRTPTAAAAAAAATTAPGLSTPTPEPPDDLAREAFLAHPDPVGLYSEPEPDNAMEQLAAQTRLRRRSARRLGLASVIVLGLTMTGLGVASVLGAPITVGVYLSAALLIFGLTLLIGARIGRPRGLAFGTVVVALAMIVTLFAQNNTAVAGGVGIRHLHYTSVAGLPAGDHLRVGQLTVDLRQVNPDRPRSYTASVGTGRLVVDLPAGVPTRLNGSVGNGMIISDGRQLSSGPDLSLREQPPATAVGPVFTVNLKVGNGQLEVRR